MFKHKQRVSSYPYSYVIIGKEAKILGLVTLYSCTDLLCPPTWPLRCLQKGLVADTVDTPGEAEEGVSITSSWSLIPGIRDLRILQSLPPLSPPWLLVTTSVSSVQFSSDGWKIDFYKKRDSRHPPGYPSLLFIWFANTYGLLNVSHISMLFVPLSCCQPLL